jgi:hypothetical protein
MTTLFISHSSKQRAWSEEIRDALKGRGYESLFLDSHPEDGIPAGVDWEQDLWRKLRQCRGLVVLCTADWLRSPWCVAEAMIARERGKKIVMLATSDITDDRQVKASGTGEAAPRLPDFSGKSSSFPWHIRRWTKRPTGVSGGHSRSLA